MARKSPARTCGSSKKEPVMASTFDDVKAKHTAPGDDYFARQAATANEDGTEPNTTEHWLDTAEARAELRRLLEWYYFEKERQAENRMEQAIDADFYDNLQWDPIDAKAVRERG